MGDNETDLIHVCAHHHAFAFGFWFGPASDGVNIPHIVEFKFITKAFQFFNNQFTDLFFESRHTRYGADFLQ